MRSARRINATPRLFSRAVGEVRRRRDALVYPGFFHATPWSQIAHLPRYLTALDHRLAKLPQNPERDARHSAVVERWWERYRERRDASRAKLGARGRRAAALESFRWSLEELAVSLFAQELKTPFPVSSKRLEKVWTELCR